MKNIFIIGAPRYRTNLFMDLLSEHPKILTWSCDEINMEWRYDNIDKNDELKIIDIKNLNKLYIRSFFKQFKNKFKKIKEISSIELIRNIKNKKYVENDRSFIFIFNNKWKEGFSN